MTRHLVDATGTHRRLQALVARGWSKSRLAQRLGMEPTNFRRTFVARRVYATTAAKVCRLYDQLWDVSPPKTTRGDRIAFSRAVRYAEAKGFAPPLAWDDDTIDDPTAQPQGVEKVRRYGVLPPPWELRWLMKGGESPLSIARRFRVQPAAVERALLRHKEAA